MKTLEHLDHGEFWSDFSIATPLEEGINGIENIFRKWIPNPIQKTSEKINIFNETYKLIYIPKNYYIPEEIFEILAYNEEYVYAIPELFGIKTDYVYVYNKDRQLTESDIHTLNSALSNAAIATSFEIPIIIQNDQTKLCFAGIKRTKSEIEHFQSSFYESMPAEFRSQTKIKTSIVNQFKVDPSKILVSARYISNLNEYDFRNGTLFKKDTFYTQITEDPVKFLKLFLVFDETKIDSMKTDVTNPSHLAIQSKFRKKVTRKSRLRDLISLLHTVWTYPTIQDAITPPYAVDANQIINSIFSSKEAPRSFKCSLHGAPPSSSLAKLSIEMCKNPTVETMSLLWDKFVKQVRHNAERKILIPSVDTEGVNYQYCVIYQKLQMINYCIKNPESGFIKSDGETTIPLVNGPGFIVTPERQVIPMRTQDQLDADDKLIKQSAEDDDSRIFLQATQLRSDIASFKASNPMSLFSDFVHWYFPHSFDPKTNDVKEGFNPEYKKVWDSTKPCEARKQQRLFDSLEQIELALDYLETLAPGEILPQIIVICMEQALFDLKFGVLPKISEKIERVNRAFLSFDRRYRNTKSPSMNDLATMCVEPVEAIEDLAFVVSCLDSLLTKFPRCPDAAQMLFECGECTITKDEKPGLQDFFKKVEFTGRQAATSRAKETTISVTGDTFSQRYFVSDKGKSIIIASSFTEFF
ncbi:hypothetical protein TVAG_159640 [Trichomonas vaginalis G3]|uniref:Rab3 GTPase-activating protein catalytic subunit n=1 Tax=Trichomonas vaginalis (strain ATCC PRA-98 / G3) TaxID=412133 RepID=A2DUQ6_TRIV3|nr:positive regulation of glutamate neurotransmitter secretion in response to membrane depolarization [Trichomonas vaginalis G3]EAY15791.1 hypothetical protein TVAG_159640 [Trichomonas vaginalis G3]KAI5525039.1 positive regulation of glutamate neurotransmitter secretion in response to membrane depolarization [Trichomonas vaginalis G3]|eukprot:XP_001328014.1 hypothetical protein [Trichomonas vaginalis G3]